MAEQKSKNALLEEYSAYFCSAHSASKFNGDCLTCDDNYGILRDFYNEALYEAAQEIRFEQNNCSGECSDDLEGMTEDYD